MDVEHITNLVIVIVIGIAMMPVCVNYHGIEKHKWNHEIYIQVWVVTVIIQGLDQHHALRKAAPCNSWPRWLLVSEMASKYGQPWLFSYMWVRMTTCVYMWNNISIYVTDMYQVYEWYISYVVINHKYVSVVYNKVRKKKKKKLGLHIKQYIYVNIPWSTHRSPGSQAPKKVPSHLWWRARALIRFIQDANAHFPQVWTRPIERNHRLFLFFGFRTIQDPGFYLRKHGQKCPKKSVQQQWHCGLPPSWRSRAQHQPPLKTSGPSRPSRLVSKIPLEAATVHPGGTWNSQLLLVRDAVLYLLYLLIGLSWHGHNYIQLITWRRLYHVRYIAIVLH